MRAALLLLVLAACGDDQVVTVDAGAELDAAPVCGISDVQRSEECKQICFVEVMRCPGAAGADCYDECRRFATGFAYCPPGAP